MKPFVFTLERMRDYKTQVLDTEKNTLGVLLKRLADIEEKIRLCTIFRHDKQEEMQTKQREGSTMRELEECKFYLENTRRQLEDLEEERIIAAQEVEVQRQIVIKASQDVTSLDKLEERQLEEYHILETRDNEKNIQEHVITQLSYAREGAQLG
ncbi:MAG: flagellar FliJ family protein [Clostridiales bacterium]|nr:flagellar FliJ family protein [Clostridiales bacterium]